MRIAPSVPVNWENSYIPVVQQTGVFETARLHANLKDSTIMRTSEVYPLLFVDPKLFQSAQDDVSPI